MTGPTPAVAPPTSDAARGRRSPTFVVLFTVFVDLVGFGVIIPLLPFYATAVGGGAAILGLVVASFFLMQFVFSPIFGRLSDRIGRRPVIVGTLVMAVVAHIVLSVAASLPLLFLARLLAGTASGNLSVAQAYVADTAPPEKRAKGMGLIGAAFGVGFIVGPVIGGVLAPFGLYVPALGAAAIALANLVLAAIYLPESLTPERRAVAAARAHRPAGWAEAFRRPAMRALLVAFFVVSFAFSAVPVMHPLLGIQRLGLGTGDLAVVFLFIGVISVSVGASLGRLVAGVGEEKLVATGTALMTAGIFATPTAWDFPSFIALNGVMAVGVALCLPLIPSLVSKRSAPEEQGSMLGVAQAFGALARVPGPLVAGLLFEGFGFLAPFLVSGALMALAFGLAASIYVQSRAAAPRVEVAADP